MVPQVLDNWTRRRGPPWPVPARQAVQGFFLVVIVQCIFGIPHIYRKLMLSEFFNPSLVLVFAGVVSLGRHFGPLGHPYLSVYMVLSIMVGVSESLASRYLALAALDGDLVPGLRKAIAFTVLTCPWLVVNTSFQLSQPMRALSGSACNLAVLVTAIGSYRIPIGPLYLVDRYFLIFSSCGAGLAQFALFIVLPTTPGEVSRTALAGGCRGAGGIYLAVTDLVSGEVDSRGRLLGGQPGAEGDEEADADGEKASTKGGEDAKEEGGEGEGAQGPQNGSGTRGAASKKGDVESGRRAAGPASRLASATAADAPPEAGTVAAFLGLPTALTPRSWQRRHSEAAAEAPRGSASTPTEPFVLLCSELPDEEGGNEELDEVIAEATYEASTAWSDARRVQKRMRESCKAHRKDLLRKLGYKQSKEGGEGVGASGAEAESRDASAELLQRRLEEEQLVAGLEATEADESVWESDEGDGKGKGAAGSESPVFGATALGAAAEEPVAKPPSVLPSSSLRAVGAKLHQRLARLFPSGVTRSQAARLASLSVAPRLVPQVLAINAGAAKVAKAAIGGLLYGRAGAWEPELLGRPARPFFPAGSTVRLGAAIDAFAGACMQVTWIVQGGDEDSRLVHALRDELNQAAALVQAALSCAARSLVENSDASLGAEELVRAFDAFEAAVQAGAKLVSEKKGAAGEDEEGSARLPSMTPAAHAFIILKHTLTTLLRAMGEARSIFRCLPAVLAQMQPEAGETVEAVLAARCSGDRMRFLHRAIDRIGHEDADEGEEKRVGRDPGEEKGVGRDVDVAGGSRADEGAAAAGVASPGGASEGVTGAVNASGSSSPRTSLAPPSRPASGVAAPRERHAARTSPPPLPGLVVAPPRPLASMCGVSFPLWFSEAWRWVEVHTFFSRTGIRVGLHLTCAFILIMVLEACRRPYEDLFAKPIWAALALVTMIQPASGASIRKGVMRTVGTVGGVFFGLVVIYIAYGINGASYKNRATKFAILALGVATVEALFHFFSAWKKDKAYLAFAAHITFCLATGIAYVEDEPMWRYGLWRCVLAVIGAGAFTFFAAVAFPVRTTELLRENVAKVLEGIAGVNGKLAGMYGLRDVVADLAAAEDAAPAAVPSAARRRRHSKIVAFVSPMLCFEPINKRLAVLARRLKAVAPPAFGAGSDAEVPPLRSGDRVARSSLYAPSPGWWTWAAVLFRGMRQAVLPPGVETLRPELRLVGPAAGAILARTAPCRVALLGQYVNLPALRYEATTIALVDRVLRRGGGRTATSTDGLLLLFQSHHVLALPGMLAKSLDGFRDAFATEADEAAVDPHRTVAPAPLARYPPEVAEAFALAFAQLGQAVTSIARVLQDPRLVSPAVACVLAARRAALSAAERALRVGQEAAQRGGRSRDRSPLSSAHLASVCSYVLTFSTKLQTLTMLAINLVHGAASAEAALCAMRLEDPEARALAVSLRDAVERNSHVV